MSKPDVRRELRYEIAIPVTLLSPRGDVALRTVDVSHRGMFLRTDEPPGKLQLLRVRIALPTTARELVVNVVAMYVSRGGPRGNGVGVSFFALNGDARNDWERFIRFVQNEHAQRRLRARLPGPPDRPSAAPLG